MEGDFPKDYPDQQADPEHPVPSFLYIVGDIVYYYGEAEQYYAQFYEPYKNYPAPIFAIPGNYDGLVKSGSSVPSLQAFMDNFCASRVTWTAESIDAERSAMTQPNCYWTLMTPYATLVGIYTNVTVNGELDQNQSSWLDNELATAPTDKALILTMHSPALSLDHDHPGSEYINNFLNSATEKGGRFPDMVVAGHAHNYQRFTRTRKKGDSQVQVPYIVAAGGCPRLGTVLDPTTGDKPVLPWKAADTDPVFSETTLVKYIDDRYGYLRLTLTVNTSSKTLKGEYFTVHSPQVSGDPALADIFTLDLQNHQLLEESAD